MENLEGGDISEVSGGESSVDTAPPPEAQEQDTSELQPPEGETAPVEAEDTDSSTDAGDLGGAEGSPLEQPDPATDPAMDAGNPAMTEGTQSTEQPNPEDGEHLPETDSGVEKSPDGSDTVEPEGSDITDADKQELPVENPEGTQEIPETPEAGEGAAETPEKQPEQTDEKELPENTETDPVAEKTEDPDAVENPEDPEKNAIKDGSDTSEQPVPKEDLDKKELEEPTEQPENQAENQPENQEQGHEVPPPDDGDGVKEKPISDSIKDAVFGPESAYDAEKYKEAGIGGAFDEVPRSRREAVYSSFENAPDEIKQTANDLSEKLSVENTKGDDCCHYDPRAEKIRMEKNMDNAEYGEVFTHEYGHFVDHQKGDVSNSFDFRNAMQQDLSQFDRSTTGGQQSFNEMMDDLMQSDAAYDRAISDNMSSFFKNDPDIIDSFNENGIACYGHSNDYWSVPGNREAEVYANCFSMAAQDNGVSCAFMEKYFPNTWSAFKNTL